MSFARVESLCLFSFGLRGEKLNYKSVAKEI